VRGKPVSQAATEPKAGSPGAGDVRPYVQSARLQGEAARPRISRERRRGVRARARGPKRATSDKALPYRSDPLGSGERKWRNPARAVRRQPSLRWAGEHGACRARRPRADLHPGITRGNRRRGSGPANKAPRWRASFRSVLELVRHGGATGHPARREATRLARGAPRSSWSCTPRDSAWPRARATARHPSGRDACMAVVSSRHAACPRGQARVNAPCRLAPT